ncbi:IclR family transcriptional regulator [Aquabacterium sp.]|jgi:DNA-binding IclR family transcriptional regulator|uniref:IclR family transcriptional regulator n=1 Tax=Aquabacterium sp. TaxID=1872578 RepID=UPI0025C725AC|nr:IclR family transcriptional regulator [Aquabacterium sp.]
MSEPTHSATSIQVLSRMFSLLDTLAQAGDSVSLKAISEQTGLHPSTAHRILNDLAAGRYVERSGPGSYRLGLRLLELGNLVKGRLNVRDLASRPMQELHRMTGHSVSLFVRQDDEALCVERTVAERSGVQVTRVMGLRLSLVGHAVGKVLLLNDSGAGLQALTQAHGLRLDALQAELHAIRQNGLALEADTPDPLQQLVAAPVFDDMGKVAASLSLNVPASRLQPEWQDALRNAAQRISAALGWQHR